MILNLTQHPATPDQIAQGVVDLAGDDIVSLKALLNFEELPSPDELPSRAIQVVEIAIAVSSYFSTRTMKGVISECMIGGAPFFMRPLEQALLMAGFRPVYAFSRRVVEEVIQTDGTVRKVAVFRHEGFVRPCGESMMAGFDGWPPK